MNPEYQCTTKDKRLLVLFTFGVLILPLASLFHSYPPEMPNKHRSWIEVQTTQGKNIVLAIEDKEDLAKNNSRNKIPLAVNDELVRHQRQPGIAYALIQDPKNQLQIGQVSPRLAFLLGQPFSVNSATIEDLSLISGIGPSLANKIVSYRETHGAITSTHRLREIKGIGPKTAKKLNNYLTFTVDGEAN